MWGICAKGVQNSLSLSCNFKSEINSEYTIGGKEKQQCPGLLRASPLPRPRLLVLQISA